MLLQDTTGKHPRFVLCLGWYDAAVRILLLLILTAACAWADPADDLLNQMTTREKVGQLNQICVSSYPVERSRRLVREGRLGTVLNAIVKRDKRPYNAIAAADAALSDELQKIAVTESRLKIPLLIAEDVIHGYRTMFPVPLGEAASFDPELCEATARVAGAEARAAGIHWTFAPMVDVCRDPRWGRIVEGAGEDPYLGARLAEARVRGFQGLSLSDGNAVMACAKHFAAYGGAEAGRDYNTVDVSERTLREVYLPPFRAAAKAGAATFMVSFNDIGGIPSSCNPFLLRQVLRGEWEWRGLVVSDWNSVSELTHHGVAADPARATQLALNAGVDIDMQSESYEKTLLTLVERGTISKEVLDEAVRRVLRAKLAVDVFKDPYSHIGPNSFLTPASVALARRAGRESIVLLKNERNVLPLAKKIRSLAVIGSLADDRESMLGNWTALGDAKDVVTVRQALQRALPRARVRYVAGCSPKGKSRAGFAEALQAAREAEAVVLVVGETGGMSGEACSRATIDVPGVQNELASQILALRKPTAVVVMSGRPLVLGTLAEEAPALLEAWFLGDQAGPAIADVLLGDYNPAGRLPASFPRVQGQIPVYYNHKNTGRPWISKFIDAPNEPRFPFGYGLSYTTFKYGKLSIAPAQVQAGQNVTVTVEVTNTGKRAGDEVVQLYLHDLVASTARPVKELKGFRRLHLKPGETRTVSFTVGEMEMRLVDGRMQWTVEPGRFDVMVGPSSVKGRKGFFEVL